MDCIVIRDFEWSFTPLVVQPKSNFGVLSAYSCAFLRSFLHFGSLKPYPSAFLFFLLDFGVLSTYPVAFPLSFPDFGDPVVFPPFFPDFGFLTTYPVVFPPFFLGVHYSLTQRFIALFPTADKKRYAGLHWEDSVKPKYINKKGLETVRRDNCPLLPKIQDEVLRLLLVEKDKQGAIDAAKKVISDLLQGKVPLDDLVISKAYSKPASEYAATQAHIVLAEKMQRRDPATAPQMGDRIPYVMVGTAGRNPKAYERVESVDYVRKHGIPVDARYYIDNQLKKPLLRVMEPVIGDTAEAEIFRGDHTRKIVKKMPKSGGLLDFFKPMPK